MTTTRTLDSYPPEFFDIWTAATERRLRLTFPSRGKATNLKHRLYAFRKRLGEVSPEIAAPYYLVDLDVQLEAAKGKPDEWVMSVSIPAWKEQIREQMGAKPLQVQVLITPEPTPVAPKNAMDEALKDLGFSPEK